MHTAALYIYIFFLPCMHSQLPTGDIIHWQQPTHFLSLETHLNLQQQQYPERGQVIGHLIVFSHQVRTWEGLKSKNSECQVVGPKEIWYATLCMHDRPSHPQIHITLRWSSIHPSHVPVSHIPPVGTWSVTVCIPFIWHPEEVRCLIVSAIICNPCSYWFLPCSVAMCG